MIDADDRRANEETHRIDHIWAFDDGGTLGPPHSCFRIREATEGDPRDRLSPHAWPSKERLCPDWVALRTWEDDGGRSRPGTSGDRPERGERS
jgi:hypothetical protein